MYCRKYRIMEKRKIQRKIGEKWEDIEMKDMQIGDRFRMYEPDGSPVESDDGVFEWTSTSLPIEIINEHGVPTLSVQVEL